MDQETLNTATVPSENPVGSVMVVGGGIAGMQTSLDLANAGYKVHLIEKKSAIGGHMAQLDKTFPTNDCSMCTISPRLVEVGRHLNIELSTDSVNPPVWLASLATMISSLDIAFARHASPTQYTCPYVFSCDSSLSAGEQS